MRSIRPILRMALPIAVIIFAPHLAGQTVAGQISGLVTDPSGAAISGASVVITDIERNVNLRSESNESGFYLVSPLPPGRYRLRAEKAGFRAHLVELIQIATQQKAELNIALQVGAITERRRQLSRLRISLIWTSAVGRATPAKASCRA